MPNIFRVARFTSSWANASWINGGQFCCAGVRDFECVMSTCIELMSLDICRTVPPTAMPEASAICSSGQEPSAAEASSNTASSIRSQIIFLIARKALHPSVFALPMPPSGNSAPGFW